MYCRNGTDARANGPGPFARVKAGQPGADDSGCARPGSSCRSPGSARHDLSHAQQSGDGPEYQVSPVRSGSQGSDIECPSVALWEDTSSSPNTSALPSQFTDSAEYPKKPEPNRSCRSRVPMKTYKPRRSEGALPDLVAFLSMDVENFAFVRVEEGTG